MGPFLEAGRSIREKQNKNGSAETVRPSLNKTEVGMGSKDQEKRGKVLIHFGQTDDMVNQKNNSSVVAQERKAEKDSYAKSIKEKISQYEGYIQSGRNDARMASPRKITKS